MASARCPSCSLGVEDDAVRCPACGSDLAVELRTTEVPTALGRSAARLEFRPGEWFAQRFTIIERIGAGGMGIVYKARDTELDTVVALKLIQPALASDPVSLQRFRREVRVTREISHANVCRVYDIGSHEDVLYLSMEWIEGETLRLLLLQAGTLKEARALQIAERIALALQAAHERGVVHRDLKPANVMVDRHGHVRVLDFGLAQERGAAEPLSGAAIAGTPPYMSPEQRRGEPLDARTDLYALGLILREMLIGRPLGAADAPLPEVHPAIAPLLARLLDPDRERRPASAAGVAGALHALLEDPAFSGTTSGEQAERAGLRRSRRRAALAVAVGVAGVALGAYWLVSAWRPDSPRPRDRRAAEYYAQGLSGLRRDAVSVSDFDAAAGMFHRALKFERDSALIMAGLAEAYWHRFEKTKAAASREEAERWTDGAYRIDPELAEVHYARALGDLSDGKFDAAKSELDRVLEKRPDFTMAWACRGRAHQALDQYALGLADLEHAARLEPDNVLVELYRGWFHEHFGQQAEAERHYRRATTLKPDSATAWNNLGGTLLYAGKFADAVPAFERAIALDDYADARSNLGTAYYYLRRWDDAVEQYRHAAELKPNEPVNWGNLGDALLMLERGDEARQVYATAEGLARQRVLQAPLDPDANKDLALYCAKAGHADCALERGRMLLELQPENAVSMKVNAVIRCLLGQDDEALDLLEQAVRLGLTRAEIEGAPEFRALAGQARYKSILELAS